MSRKWREREENEVILLPDNVLFMPLRAKNNVLRTRAYNIDFHTLLNKISFDVSTIKHFLTRVIAAVADFFIALVS